jgi:hypothetical protein
VSTIKAFQGGSGRPGVAAGQATIDAMWRRNQEGVLYNLMYSVTAYFFYAGQGDQSRHGDSEYGGRDGEGLTSSTIKHNILIILLISSEYDDTALRLRDDRDNQRLSPGHLEMIVFVVSP